MKNLLLILIAVLGTAFVVQAQTDYQQWECHHFKAKAGQEEAFEKALAEHNKKFHNESPYKTGIFEKRTGPYSGTYELAMGPMTFTDMEGRPSSEAHNTHWRKVLELAEPLGETIYWRADKDIVYAPEGAENFSTMRWRNSTLLPGGGKRFKALMSDVVDVMKAKGYNASFRMYWRFGMSEGPHVVTELGMENLAFFDEPITFQEDFDEIHGEGAYDRFVEDISKCVDRSKTYDELVNFRSDLSSDY